MLDKFREKCGIAAVFGHELAAILVYYLLFALQHRGQESAGIASENGREILLKKGMGLVSDVFSEENLAKLSGALAIGHNRYSTAGGASLINAQPFTVLCSKGRIAVAHNGNITNADELKKELESQGVTFQSTSDTEVILHLIARSKQQDPIDALSESLNRLKGAFSLVFIIEGKIVAARDPLGFRPLILGTLKGENGQNCHIAASETCALDLVEAEYAGEVKPGEMVIIGPNGLERRQFAVPDKHKQCVFEHIYFSRPDSFVFGRSVHESRIIMGRLLARSHPAAADFVVPVPDSGVSAAVGYAYESGIPYNPGLIRSHYIGRTFIEPAQRVRNLKVRQKLNPNRSVVEGRRIVLVDDSIVRGTTSLRLINLLRNAGVKEVHMRISCPPIISPCYYGIDTPTRNELIAASKTAEEVRLFIGADSLGCLTIENLKEAVKDSGSSYCYRCFQNGTEDKL